MLLDFTKIGKQTAVEVNTLLKLFLFCLLCNIMILIPNISGIAYYSSWRDLPLSPPLVQCYPTTLLQTVISLFQPDGNHPTNYGFKRFQRDGHHTVKENPGKKYYDPAELTVSNWPQLMAQLGSDVFRESFEHNNY